MEEAGVVLGFHYEVGGAGFEPFDCEVYFGVGGEEDYRDAGGESADFAQPVEALVAVVDGGFEVHVEEDAVGEILAQQGRDARGGGRGHDPVEFEFGDEPDGGED